MIARVLRPIQSGETRLMPGDVVDTKDWRPNAVKVLQSTGKIEPLTTPVTELPVKKGAHHAEPTQ